MADGNFDKLTVADSIGIGTETPNAQLHIDADVGEGKVLVESGSNLFKLSVDGTGAAIGMVNAVPFALQTDGSSRLTINALGNVGIGEPNPAAKLVINGDLKLQAGIAINQFSNDGTLADNSDLSVPTEKAVKTYVESQITGLNTALVNGLATKALLGGSGTQDFATKNLNTSGNLTVTGNLDVTGTTTFRNIEQHQGDLELGNQDTDQVRIHGMVRSTHSSGALQFGSPLTVAGKLTAMGNANVNNTFLGDVGHGSTWAGFSHGSSASANSYALLQSNNGLYTLLNKKSGGGYLGFRVDNLDKMIIKDSGNVGIGTTEPRTPLHVLGRISTGADFTSAGSITFYPPDGFAWFHIDNGPAGGRPMGRLRISHGGSPGAQEIISILQNTNVGIGTSAPSQRLEVAGNVRANDYLRASSRDLKTNIADVSAVEAMQVLAELKPIKFCYKDDPDQETHLGFIAEEVPDLLASRDRKSVSTTDLVALLTKVVQAQQILITQLAEKVNQQL
jgi:Chaperone of endosialidase